MQHKYIFHKLKLLFFVFIIISWWSCSVNPQNTVIIKRYCVGQGGGFTGAYTEFSFSEDGKVYKRDFNYDRDVYYKDLSPLDLRYFLEKIQTLGIETAEINRPGNLSKYIEIRQRETSVNKLVWDANNNNAPHEIVDFQKELYDKLSARPE